MRSGKSQALVTGGAGFIGTNLAHRLALSGERVRVLDNLSRPGVERNLDWLTKTHGGAIEFVNGDVRELDQVRGAVEGVQSVFHLAAQVAVTTSLADPIADFEVNARGTLNVLEAVRGMKERPFLLYTSTNKVLGGLERLRLKEREWRYEPEDPEVRARGIGEEWGIEFCSPYGCSKGAADQYVLDYSRCYGIPATVFRMSCIYGPHQCGTEDQGWVAHFVRQAILGETITFYGDGKQVRDALYVEDLVDAFLLARSQRGRTSGRAFNIGGGPGNTTSLVELVGQIAELHGRHPEIRKEPWRPSDQRYYVSDTSKFSRMTGWSPSTPLSVGVGSLYRWMSETMREQGNFLSREDFDQLTARPA